LAGHRVEEPAVHSPVTVIAFITADRIAAAEGARLARRSIVREQSTSPRPARRRRIRSVFAFAGLR
jgi:hypothetical protein